MTVVMQDKFVLFSTLCLGFWAMGMILGGVIPVLNYITTGSARTISFNKKWNLIMRGKKARQFVLAQFCFFSGFATSFISMLLLYNLWWILLVVALISIPFMFHATIHADRAPRKNMFFESEDFWHS